MTPYSIFDVVPDGFLGPSPRWVLHLIKLATHAAAAFLVVCLLAAFTPVSPFFLGGWIGGMVTYAGILLHKRAAHSPLNRPDWVFDSSFPIIVTGGGLLAERDYLAALLMILVGAVVYVLFRTRGSP